MPGGTDGKFTTSDGCDIAYTLRSHANSYAPRVVLIHSLALDRSIWNGVISELWSTPPSSLTTAVATARARRSTCLIPPNCLRTTLRS